MAKQSKQSKTGEADEKSDWLWGCGAIADFIGTSRGKTYSLIQKGRLPVVRLGHKTIVASRRALNGVISSDN